MAVKWAVPWPNYNSLYRIPFTIYVDGKFEWWIIYDRSDYNFPVNWMIRDNDSQYAANESRHSAPPFLCVASLQSNTATRYRHPPPPPPVTFPPHSFINNRHYGRNRWNERRIFEGSPINTCQLRIRINN